MIDCKRHETCARSGFTLMELMITVNILGILIVPLVGFFVLPMRVQADLEELNRVNHTAGLFHNHLSEDIRCANSIEIGNAQGTRDDLSALFELRIQKGNERIIYGRNEDGLLIRNLEGAVPLTHRYNGLAAEFSFDDSGQFVTVQVDTILDYRLLRGGQSRQRRTLYRSYLRREP